MDPGANPPPTHADLVRGFLADRDAACPFCGYNLRGAPGDVCPECGKPLALAIGTRPPMSRMLRRVTVCFCVVLLIASGIRVFSVGSFLVRFPSGGWYMLVYAATLLADVGVVLVLGYCLYWLARRHTRSGTAHEQCLAAAAICVVVQSLLSAFPYLVYFLM